MPLAPCLLAALTPDEHDVSLVDMFYGDRVDYGSDADVVALTVRMLLATIAYEIAEKFLQRRKKVVLGGPHVFAFPKEAKTMPPRSPSARVRNSGRKSSRTT